MNHSQAIMARNLIADRIVDLELIIKSEKEEAARYWKAATPETARGQDCFYMLNSTRNYIRRCQKELAALAELSAMLKQVAKAENAFEGWAKRNRFLIDSEIDFDEVLTDEDYRSAVTCFDENGIAHPAGWDLIEAITDADYPEAR